MHTYLNDLSVFYVGNNSGNPQYQLIRKTDKVILAQGPKSQPLIDLCETLREIQSLTEAENPTNTTKLLAAIGKIIDSKGGKLE